MEKYKSGWLLSVLRLDASGTKWYFISPEDAVKDVDYGNLVPANFKDIRPLIKQSQMVSNSDAVNSMGLPITSVYLHKDIGA